MTETDKIAQALMAIAEAINNHSEAIRDLAHATLGGEAEEGHSTL